MFDKTHNLTCRILDSGKCLALVLAISAPILAPPLAYQPPTCVEVPTPPPHAHHHMYTQPQYTYNGHICDTKISTPTPDSIQHYFQITYDE